MLRTLSSAAAMAATEANQSVVLGGTCVPGLNGQVFSMQGTTASGDPYYAAKTIGAYLYLDPSCDGSAGSRWIMDDTAPSLTAENQLNGRGQCAYFADREAPDADSRALALGTSAWNMNCDGAWTVLNFTLAEQPQAFTVANACAPELNTDFKAAGVTASGVAYYRSENGAYYIYQDPSCDSAAEARWIIDDREPNKTSASQLNGLGQCLYVAHQPTVAGTTLQMGIVPWTMFCSDGWQNLDLALVEQTTSEVPSTTNEVAGETSSTTAKSSAETSSTASTTTTDAAAEVSSTASSTSSAARESSTIDAAPEASSTSFSTAGTAAASSSRAFSTTDAAAETSSAAAGISTSAEGISASTSRRPHEQLSAAFAPGAGRALALWLLSAGLLVA
eukprot:TRINITY_DN1077_c0_g1_i2.p1 TRINITY_DN1077_c0_g1~~TRINITY_DN1077_c0_g1_i2.p1  ORF type:complete len:391 (+),score=102.48 TRINITY_DN1077_c0_g1_i2:86-1258(+)